MTREERKIVRMFSGRGTILVRHARAYLRGELSLRDLERVARSRWGAKRPVGIPVTWEWSDL